MPVLAANQVTLAEVLEVKGSPLNEEEIWAVLSHAGKAVEQAFADGKGKQHGQPSLVISPETLILSHSGHVKVSTHVGREKSKNPTYRAPELSSRTVSPSDGAVEKMYVYSLGMTLYFAAEYGLESKMSHLSVSLGNLLLSMCEELARSRYSLRQVLAACGSKYGDQFYSKIIKSLVVLVLGNNIPEVIQRSDEDKYLARGYSSDDQHPSRSLRARYRSSLELPSPPLASRASRGQVTSEELIGSNDRTMTSPDEQLNYHSKNKYMTKIPHTLDKYRKYLEKARHQKTVTSPVVADRSIDLLRHRYGSMPAINGRHSLELSSRRGYDRTRSLDRNDKGYEESSINNGLWKSQKLRESGSGSLGNLNTGQSSDASSETSSLSDHHRSTLSSAPSSSLVSLMEGSYVPASSLTDLGSDYWGSMASLKDAGGSQRSGEWHRSSIGDLRSVSQLSSHDRTCVKNGYADAKPQWANTGSRRRYRSEQNLVSPDATDGEKKSKKTPKAKLRKFFGPEFVQVSQDPNQSLVNITPKKQVSDKKVLERRTVTVVMLNEQRLEMTVESSTKVQELFNQITKYIGITEKLYFGLTKIEDDEHLFLDFDTKLSKHAPAGWKEQSKKFTGKYVLYFRVKFYVENLALFRHHETSHQLYLQLRSDVINDRVYSDVDPVLNLASLALQAEYGDYSKKRFGENYFKPKHYLPHRILVKLSEDHVSQKLRALHKVQCGLSQEEAELKFIKESKKLAEYGMHLYKTKLSKKEDQIIYLGVCVRGVTIFEFKQNKRKPLERHSWSTIKKLAFKKKKFYIEPRKDETGNKQNKLAFLSSSYKRSKYLLYLCTSFHRFQMRMKVRLLAMEESSAVPEEKGRHSIGSGYGPGVSTPHQNGGSQIGGKFLNGHEDDVDSSFESRELSRASSADGERLIGQNITPDRPNGEEALPYVLNSTPPSPSETTPSPGANKKKTAEIIMSPDRKVKAIKLKKDARGALGLTVVGGEDAGRLHFGIFIKKISPGSVAHQDGRLQVGDRILAVNGKSLEYVSHDEAVQALKNTPVNVELLVSQSSRTDSDIDMSALYSPVTENTQRPSSGCGGRMSPYLFEGQGRPGNANGDYGDDNFNVKNVSRDLESAYTADVGNPQSENSPEMSRPISRSSSDASLSNPSFPEQGNRNVHRGGVKLPGMTDGQLEDLKLTRNSHVRSSGTSHVSLESPGSIASFSEKFNRLNSLPDSDIQIHTRKSSTGSAINEERLSLEKLPVGIVMDVEERRLSEDDKVPSYFTVELDKVSGSLGLNISGGINTNVSDGGIFVKSLYPNGPADLDGRIQVGHKILSVNGISLQGVTHKQAVETIKRAPVHAVLVIEGSPGETADHADNGPYQNPDQGTVFEVVLTKGIGGLGMSLVGGTDCGDEYGDQLRIKAMFPGQPAENSGKLRVGDIIMAANGVPLAGRTSREAINVLRDQPLRVVLTVKRDPSSIPPSLLRRGSFSQSLDPNEVLTAIHSRLERDDSRHSRFTDEPGNDEPSLREASDPREISDLHASASRNSSNAKRENGGILPHKHELPNNGGRKSEIYSVEEATSLDEGRTNESGSELQKADNRRILLDKNQSPEDCFGTNTGTGRSEVGINRRNSELADNDLRSETPSRLLPSNESFALGNCHQSRDQVEIGMGAMGISDGKRTVPGTKFGGGVSAGGNDSHQKFKSLNPKPVETTQLFERAIPSPLVGGVFSSQTREDIGDEGGKERERKGSSGRTFQNDKKERLAPDEEVLDIVLHKGSSGLGFTLAGGADTVGGCFVREIIGDPARADGRLRAKDQIVMVNGQDTTNKRHMEAVNILRSTRNEVHLVIRRRPDKVKSKTKDGLDVKTISVIRTTRGVIGLTLAQDKEGQIYAAEVVPDEPAAKHGGLKRGDVILEINGERVDGNDLKFAEDCLERARPVVTVVIKQFRSETESKYVLCSPTESDHEVPTNISRSRSYNMVVVPPEERLSQVVNSYNPDFLPSDETSPENVPAGVLYAEVELTPEIQNSGILSSENEPSAEPPSEPIQLNISHEPAQENYNGKHAAEAWSADDSYGEEKNTTSGIKEMEDDATQGPENEEYPSDDDELLLKEEVIITSLEKGRRGLGFSLFSAQTVRNTPGLFIRSIQPNSVVAEDGKIKVGDQLMKVNGVNVERLEHSEVITLLRSLSGLIKLELLRIQDENDGEELFTSLPRQPDVNNHSADTVREEVDSATSPVTTPDFSEDVGIVLNALHTKQDFPLSDSQESLPSPAGETSLEPSEQPDVVEPPYDQTVDTDEEKIESWPQPPTSLELQSGEVLNEASNGLNPVELDGNQVATSEDETTSITFSEDGFLEELEDLQYTPSPESDRVRSERSLIPVKPGSTLLNNVPPRMPELKRESIEMSAFRRDENTEHPRVSVDETEISMDNTMAETNMSRPEEIVSPLIPESFLNASIAASSSQATSPEVPPPLPTTPIPSDEDLSGNTGQRVTPRDPMNMRERFAEVVKQENKGRFDYPLRPKSPLITRRSKSVEPSGPLLEIQGTSSLYSGQGLKNMVQKLEKAISSGEAAGEFQALRELKPVDNCPSGKRALNKEKNRYRNVLPYEKTRVILTGDEQTDYINANYVDTTVGSDAHHYIATQGPLPVTAGDFWRMVWERECQVIAMVTLDMECGKVKCHRYWPESPELPVKVNPSLEVHLESVETHGNYVQRIIRIENIQEEQSLDIVHLNFVAWPDHGVPKSACDLVEFIKKFRENTSVGPSVVHCSAGIGRTGTLLTIDTCMKYIERGLEFDIYSIVHNLRQQRPGMIQTKDQYLFCYQSCVEILKSLQA